MAAAADGAGVSAPMSAALDSLAELVPVLLPIVATAGGGRSAGRASPPLVLDATATAGGGTEASPPRGSASAAAASAAEAEGREGGGVAASDGSRGRQRATSDAVEEMGGKLMRFLRG